MKKVYPDAKSALAGVLKDGMMIMAGGFGLCGMPTILIEAIRDSGVKNLTCVSNNAGIDGAGLGLLLETRQIKKMIASYVGENKLFAQQFLAGELEIEFNPQGTLAERMRAGGAGIPAFFTKTGVGTDIAKGKEERTFNGERYIMETGLVADLAVVHAWKGDTEGNLVYRKTARNFNPMMATAARVTVAEVEHLVQPGELDGDHIHHAGRLRPAHHSHHRREADRAAHAAQAPRAAVGRRQDHALDPRSDGRTRREGIARRLLRQSRHRHSDAGVELHSERHERAAPERERHARLRAVSLRGRRRPGPDQCRQADRHGAADHELFLLGRLVRDDPRRTHRHRAARRHAGRRERRPRQLDDPRQDGEGHGRRDGPRRRA